jgi:SAM-dependent methyltransferase
VTDASNPWLAYWERVPEGRLLFAPESEEYVRNFLREFEPKPTDRVLDYGCGFGTISRLLATKIGTIRYWDDVESIRRIAARNLAGVENAGEWNGEEDGFDFVLVNSVIQYLSVDELKVNIAEWAALLAPTGRIVLSDWSEPGHSTIADLWSLFGFSLRRGYFNRAMWNTLAEWRRYAATARVRPPYHPARCEIDRFAAAAGLSACYLARNLTHFRGRCTAVLSRKSAHASDARESRPNLRGTDG